MIGRHKTAPKERRKLASYEVAGTIGKIILSCRRRAVAALWRAAKAEGTMGNEFIRRPFRTLIFIREHQPLRSWLISIVASRLLKILNHAANVIMVAGKENFQSIAAV
jgi:hypothetical protein